MKADTLDTLGKRLKALRLYMGFTQGQVADHLGIDRSAYCCYEIERAVPGIYSVAQLATLFHVSTDWLLFGAGDGINFQTPTVAPELSSETFVTLTNRERGLIAQIRLLPNRDQIFDLVERMSIDYIGNSESLLFPGLKPKKRRKKTEQPNK